MDIKKLGLRDCEKLAVLFNHYRQFYGCPPDFDLAYEFLRDCMKAKGCIGFGAFDGPILVGFALIYPSFCPVRAERTYDLHDLYVSETMRRGGIATKLIDHVNEYARRKGIVRIDNTLNKKNVIGHALMDKAGFSYANEYHVFSKDIK